jgi:hypothetical protein
VTDNLQWSQIVARAWADQEFKARLLTDPDAVLRENGIDVEGGARALVVEDTERVRHFILPPSPAGELSEEELSPSMGLDSWCGYCGHCHRCGRCGCGCAPA